MRSKEFSAFQWNTNGASSAEVEYVLRQTAEAKKASVITLQGLEGSMEYSNQAAEIARILGMNHKYIPADEATHNGIAILSPHLLCFSESFQNVAGRRLKAEILFRGQQLPRVSILSVGLSSDLDSIDPVQLAQLLSPASKDRPYYAAFGSFDLDPEHCRPIQTQLAEIVPSDLTVAKPPHNRTNSVGLIVPSSDRLGFRHVQTEPIHTDGHGYPAQHHTLAMELPDRPVSVPESRIASSSPQESRPIMLYPRDKPHRSS